MKVRTTVVVEYESETPHDVCHHWTQSQQAQWAMHWIWQDPKSMLSATTQPAEAPAHVPERCGRCGWKLYHTRSSKAMICFNCAIDHDESEACACRDASQDAEIDKLRAELAAANKRIQQHQEWLERDSQYAENQRLTAELASANELNLALRKRLHQIDGHNQFFERCESSWCHPVPCGDPNENANPAAEGYGKAWKSPAEYDIELAAAESERDAARKDLAEAVRALREWTVGRFNDGRFNDATPWCARVAAIVARFDAQGGE